VAVQYGLQLLKQPTLRMAWWLEKISSFIQIATVAGIIFRFVQKLSLWMDYWNRRLVGNSGLPWVFGRGSERTSLAKLWKMISLF